MLRPAYAGHRVLLPIHGENRVVSEPICCHNKSASGVLSLMK